MCVYVRVVYVAGVCMYKAFHPPPPYQHSAGHPLLFIWKEPKMATSSVHVCGAWCVQTLDCKEEPRVPPLFTS